MITKLELIRRERNLTQTELARRAHTSQRYVSMAESGDRLPPGVRRRIAEALSLSPEAIWDSDGRAQVVVSRDEMLHVLLSACLSLLEGEKVK